VDSGCRGTGAGRELFLKMLSDAGGRGVKKMRIDTDDSCSVGFYRAIGAKEVYHATAKCGGEVQTENVYIFAVDLRKMLLKPC